MPKELDKAAVTTTTNTNNTREKSKIWLNIGYTVELENGETQFVSLPFGLALDTMNEAITDTSNKNFNNLNKSKNELLQDLLEAAEGVAPGTGVLISDLQLELRVKAEPVEPDTDENPYRRKHAFTVVKS